MYASIKEGKSERELLDLHPTAVIMYQRGVQYAKAITCVLPRDPSNAIVVTWYCGPSGSGKSRLAYETCPQAYRKNMTAWWDHYSGEKTVCMDDLRSNSFPFAELLRILDRYPLLIGMKGSTCQLSATHFLITSIFKPEDCFKDAVEEEPMYQLLRRITNIYEMTNQGDLSYTVLKDDATVYAYETMLESKIKRSIKDHFA